MYNFFYNLPKPNYFGVGSLMVVAVAAAYSSLNNCHDYSYKNTVENTNKTHNKNISNNNIIILTIIIIIIIIIIMIIIIVKAWRPGLRSPWTQITSIIPTRSDSRSMPKLCSEGVYACVCLCVCVCGCESVRERESVCVYVYVFMCKEPHADR